MESSLSSILSGEAAQPEAAEVQQPVETQEVQQEVEQEAGTGEEQTGTPPEQPQKDDPLDKARKGLEAAAAAERRKRQEAEQALAAARQELEAFRRQSQPQQTQTQHQERDTDPKPLRSQFETEDEWLDARDAWRDRQREQEAKAKQEQEREQTLRQKSESIMAEAMTLEGFSLEAFARVPVTDAMYDAILESEAAPRLVHYLQQNPAEATRISALSAAKQIAEMTRIEDKLKEAPKEEGDKPEPKDKPQLPNTLTQARDTRGRFSEGKGYDGPTPLNAILK